MSDLSETTIAILGESAAKTPDQETLARNYLAAQERAASGERKPFDGDYSMPVGAPRDLFRAMGLETRAGKALTDELKKQGVDQAGWDSIVRGLDGGAASFRDETAKARGEVLAGVFGKDDTGKKTDEFINKLKVIGGEDTAKALGDHIRNSADAAAIKALGDLVGKFGEARPSFAGGNGGASFQDGAPTIETKNSKGEKVVLTLPYKAAGGQIHMGTAMTAIDPETKRPYRDTDPEVRKAFSGGYNRLTGRQE